MNNNNNISLYNKFAAFTPKYYNQFLSAIHQFQNNVKRVCFVLCTQFIILSHTSNNVQIPTLFRFRDKAAFDYGTSIPPSIDADQKDHAAKKIIYCIHGKLSGCCTLVKGGSVDNFIDKDFCQSPPNSKMILNFIKHIKEKRNYNSSKSSYHHKINFEVNFIQ